MTILLVVCILNHLLVFLWRLEGFARWAVTKVIVRHEDLGWIGVSFLLELSNLVLGKELDTKGTEKVTDVHRKETAFKGSQVLTTTRHVFREDITDLEVGRNQHGEALDLRRLVLLIHRIPGFITDGLEELRTESLTQPWSTSWSNTWVWIALL